jgi:hypothetical protein
MVGAMTRSGRRLPHWLSVVLLAAVLALVTLPAAAQAPAPFRVTHAIDKGTQPQVNVSGRVFNDARADAIDVYITAEALDAGGKVIASGVSYVGAVPAGSSTAFGVKVPSARAAASFRVLVTSFRFGFANQS